MLHHHRRLITALTIALAIAALALTGLAQAPAAGPGLAAGGRTSSWTSPKTAWGHPDLQGLWENGTITPLERPADLAGREFLTDEELAKRNQDSEARADRRPDSAAADVELAYNQVWWDRGGALKRTSLIVDPSDGRIPSLTPEGERRRAAAAERRRQRGAFDSWEDRPLQERCLLYHAVPPMPTGYNNNYHIAQTPDHVAIRYEMLAETRIVPIDGRPPLGPGIRQWMGVGRGRWEGNTLVVETTNFSEKTTFRFPAANERIRIIERFTRSSANTIDYTFTVDDPITYTRSWTAELPMRKTAGPILEYACHEANYSIVGVLRGARFQEAEALKGKKP